MKTIRKTKSICAGNFLTRNSRQSLILPDDVEKDKISANVNDGVLTIDLPKRTPEEKAKVNRQIEIH